MAAQKIIGVVTSDVQDKTIVVTQTTRETHPLYGKKYSKNRKFAAHDENNEAKVGDRVEIVETRPISKTVHFELAQILERSHETVTVKKTEVEEEIEAKAAERKAKAEAKKEAAESKKDDVSESEEE
ncbi:MAG: 30S ribosomal protein S17 [Candidatus Nomurabacteria bacterium]|jgi:small subunit ribosomal protein S17|nr:30S ribosomal protein S17 [Candidatus Nomurabacteria bacterium]